MRRLALCLSIAAALLVPAGALAAGGPVGSFSARVASPAAFKGTWVLKFTKAGTYTVAQNGQVVVRGKYTVAGAKMTLGHESGLRGCLETGKYTFKRTGKKLTFTKISDSKSCAGRSAILGLSFTSV